MRAASHSQARKQASPRCKSPQTGISSKDLISPIGPTHHRPLNLLPFSLHSRHRPQLPHWTSLQTLPSKPPAAPTYTHRKIPGSPLTFPLKMTISQFNYHCFQTSRPMHRFPCTRITGAQKSQNRHQSSQHAVAV